MTTDEMERITLAELAGREPVIENDEQQNFLDELRRDLALMDMGAVTAELPGEWDIETEEA